MIAAVSSSTLVASTSSLRLGKIGFDPNSNPVQPVTPVRRHYGSGDDSLLPSREDEELASSLLPLLAQSRPDVAYLGAESAEALYAAQPLQEGASVEVQASTKESEGGARLNATEEEADEERKGDSSSFSSIPTGRDGEPLTDEELTQIEDLKERDAEVKRHEQAHLAAAGGISIGGASFEYQEGPDGKRYAVGGEVSIDTSSAPSAEETVNKMDTVIRAALAPSSPSAQDRMVAAQARQVRNEANIEIRKNVTEEISDPNETEESTASSMDSQEGFATETDKEDEMRQSGSPYKRAMEAYRAQSSGIETTSELFSLSA